MQRGIAGMVKLNRRAAAALVALLMAAPVLTIGVVGQAQEGERVNAIAAPTMPLPNEAVSQDVTKFSFMAYGDTRGRRDGVAIQYEHSLIVDSMLAEIKSLRNTDYAVRFILHSGDAVAHGQNPKEWNMSFVDLINRLTTEGGVPYFLAPGNHDVTSAATLDDPERQQGLKNFFALNANLIPPDGSPRRLAGYPTFSFGYGNTF